MDKEYVSIDRDELKRLQVDSDAYQSSWVKFNTCAFYGRNPDGLVNVKLNAGGHVQHIAFTNYLICSRDVSTLSPGAKFSLREELLSLLSQLQPEGFALVPVEVKRDAERLKYAVQHGWPMCRRVTHPYQGSPFWTYDEKGDGGYSTALNAIDAAIAAAKQGADGDE